MSTMSSPAYEPTPPRAAPQPIGAGERYVSIDVLRGFALLGILLLNIQSFAMPGAAYMNPTAYGDMNGANNWVWYFTHLLADQKFMTIFSMLFGAGIVVMTSRSEQRTGRSAAVHYRRMGWLILFGLLHAHLLWYGDILYTYGMCGLAAYLFRRMRPLTLIVIGVLLLSVTTFINLGMYGLFQIVPEEGRQGWEQGMNAMWRPSPEEIQDELDTYRGGWLDQQLDRMFMSIFFQTFLFAMFMVWRVLGLMLIGMALFKLGVFSAARSYATYAVMVCVGIPLGVALTMYEISLYKASNWSNPVEAMNLYGQVHYWATCFHSLGYVGLIMLVCKAGVLRPVQYALASVGRMAFSNYLLQTVLCTTLFYGHGFGQFGYLTRVEQMYVVLAVSAVQLAWSPIWLKYFRFGPMEWLWRSLTYWKLQPMRRGASEEATPLGVA